MEAVVIRILVSGIGRLIACVFSGTYVAYINLNDFLHKIEDATHGILTIVIGILTIIFLWYQIKKIKKDLKKKDKTK